jgi:hypothetical protein
MATRSSIETGDYFSVPLHRADSELHIFALGQVISVEKHALNSVACAFWPTLESDVSKQLSTRPIVVQLVTRDSLTKRIWKKLGNSSVHVNKADCLYEIFREAAWVGAKIEGSGIIRDLLRAYHGIEYWDSYADPNYFSELLLPGVSIPATAKFKKQT